MVTVDVLNAEDSVHALFGMDLKEADFVLLRKADITVQLVGAEHGPRFNTTAKDILNVHNGRLTETANLGNGLPIAVYGAWNADFLLG